MSVWDDQVWARTAPPPVSDWFRSVLGESHVTCVWFDPEVERRVDPHYADPRDRVGFADGFPLLLTNEASLAELNHRLPGPVSMNRFRPNVVVEGHRAFEEDDWDRIDIGSISFRVSKPCARCQIPNVEQSTGTMGKEPMRTLATFRRIDGEIIFGQNLVHDNEGTLRVGDPCTPY